MSSISAEPAIKPAKSKFVSSRVESIPPSGIRKFFDLIASMDGAISLGVGEPDFVTPWHIRAAAITALERGYTMYTSNYGLLELREALADHLAGLYGVHYDPKCELLITMGVSEALDIALRAVIDPGDEIIIPDPGYVSYQPCTVLAGGVAVPVLTTEKHDFKMLPEDVEAHITPRTKAILLGYPNNPTGAVMHREDLEAIARIAEKYDLLVISDEIYDRLTYNGGHTCFTSLPGMRERTILLGGLSKAYAMTGWRIGYAAAPCELLDPMLKIHQYASLCAPIMGQKAAIEALRHGEDDVKMMVEDYNRRRRLMVSGLCEIGLSCYEPKGALYAFPSVESTGMTDEEFAEKLLLEQKVAVVPGSAFGAGGKGHVRCCYAVAEKKIEEALERMEKFVLKYRGPR